MTGRKTGVVKFQTKNYGFIRVETAPGEYRDIYYNNQSFLDEVLKLEIGMRVSLFINPTPRGDKANGIRLLEKDE